MISGKVVIDTGDFLLNVDKSTIEKDGNVLELTKNEFRILKILVQNIDKIVTREEIMVCLWDSDSFIGDSTLTVNMTRLRNKLDEIGLNGLIETKRGQGYILKRRK